MIKKYFYSDKGFLFPTVILIFMVLVIVSYTLVINQGRQMISSAQKNMGDKASQLAEAGVEYAIGMLRFNSEYTRAPSDNDSGNDPIPRELNGKGEIRVTIKKMDHPEYGAVAVVISSGIYHQGKYPAIKAVRSLLKVDNPGDYFCATQTKFIVGSDSHWDAGNGTIYGNVLEFLDDPSLPSPHIDVYKAEYHSECIPDPSVAGSLAFVNFVATPPEQVPYKILPVISSELMQRYYKAAFNNGVDSSFLTSPVDYSASTPLKVPGETPLPTFTNGTNIWYYPNYAPLNYSTNPPTPTAILDLDITQLHFKFMNNQDNSMIIAVNGDVYIRGEIKQSMDPPTYPGSLALIVKGNVYIDIDAILGGVGAFQIKDILIIATNGKFMSIRTGPTKKSELQFYGAALFRDSFDLADGFDVREYTYSPAVKDIDNLPFMVYPVEHTLLTP